MAEKYITRILTATLTDKDKLRKSDEIAQIEATLADAEARMGEHKRASAETQREIRSEILKHRTELGDASAAIRAGVETREVQCYKKVVKGKECLFRADTNKIVDEADIVAGQQLDISEAE